MYCHLNNIKSSIHEHGIFFQLFGSLISFNNVSYFSDMSFVLFYCLFLKYFIFSDLIVNEIIFLILFLYCSWQVYRKITDFVYWSYILQTCLTCLLILIVCLVYSLGFSMYETLSSANRVLPLCLCSGYFYFFLWHLCQCK